MLRTLSANSRVSSEVNKSSEADGFVFLFCVGVGSGWFNTSLAVFWVAFVFWAVFLCLFGCRVRLVVALVNMGVCWVLLVVGVGVCWCLGCGGAEGRASGVVNPGLLETDVLCVVSGAKWK